jgi:hypothetical protein
MLREQNEELENCRFSAVDVLVVAIKIVVVFAAFKGRAAKSGALSTLPFLVKQLVKLTSVGARDDQKNASRSSSRKSYRRSGVLLNIM